MKFVKGLILGLLSLLLFLSLSVFGMVLALRVTILDPEFAVAEVNKMDMPALTRQLADLAIIPSIPKEMSYMKEPIYSSLSDFAPSLKQQVLAGVRSGYDYFLGKTQKLSIPFSFKALLAGAKDKGRQALQQNLPAQLAAAPSATIDQYYNLSFQQLTQIVPETYTIDETMIGSQNMADVRKAREYISYAPMAYWGLIALMLLLIAGIVLISRDIEGIRELGINFLMYGVLGYASLLVTRYLIGQYADPFIANLSASMAVPQALLSWLSQVSADVSALAPLQIFSIVLLAAGIVLIVVSFVYKPRAAQSVA